MGLEAGAAHPASITRNQFGVNFPSHTSRRCRVVALHFSSGVYINEFGFFFFFNFFLTVIKLSAGITETNTHNIAILRPS